MTAHHLLYNRNAIFTGWHSAPLLLPAGAQARKRTARRWCRRPPAAASKFFLGTDSAPHPAHLKEHATGCAGCYTAHAAMELYAQAFDAAAALGQAGRLCQLLWRRFLRPAAQHRHASRLRREAWTPPESFAFGDAQLKPLAGWRAPGVAAWSRERLTGRALAGSPGAVVGEPVARSAGKRA